MEVQATTSELFGAPSSISFPATVQMPLAGPPAGVGVGFTSISPKSVPTAPLFHTVHCSTEEENRALGNKVFMYLCDYLFYCQSCSLDCKHPKDICISGALVPKSAVSVKVKSE